MHSMLPDLQLDVPLQLITLTHRFPRRIGHTPLRSSSSMDSLVNSALGALPPMTNIRIERLFFGPLLTFMKRREAPGGNEITSSGF